MNGTYRIPEQLSLITFNDSSIALHHVPQLTAIDINPWQLGAEAVRQLKLHLDSPMDMASKVLVPHRLVIRDSCAPLSAGQFKTGKLISRVWETMNLAKLLKVGAVQTFSIPD